MLYSELAKQKQKCNAYLRGNGEIERAALSLNALCPYLAPVRFHDVFGDGESQPGAAPGPGFIDSVEPLEDARDILQRNADSRVLDSESDFA